MFNYNLYETHLYTKQFGRHLKYFQSISSTNEQAKAYINDFKHGYTIITKNQVNGRGRQDNVWYSIPNKSLTFSVIINHNKLNNKKLLSIISCLAIIKAIKEYTNIDCKVKWPNDIMLNQKKLGGILIEKINDFLILGIGINVNESFEDLNINIKKISTSLHIFNSKFFELEILFANILNKLEDHFNSKKNNPISEWNEYCCHINKEIIFHDNNKIKSGIFKGINNNGEAIIDINNKINYISTGVINL